MSEPPKGITVEKVTPEGPGLIVSLATDAAAVEPGLKGNLIFEVVREWTPAPTEEQPKPKPQRHSYGILPAIPFEVPGTNDAEIGLPAFANWNKHACGVPPIKAAKPNTSVTC